MQKSYEYNIGMKEFIRAFSVIRGLRGKVFSLCLLVLARENNFSQRHRDAEDAKGLKVFYFSCVSRVKVLKSL